MLARAGIKKTQQLAAATLVVEAKHDIYADLRERRGCSAPLWRKGALPYAAGCAYPR